jgi:hypothetical protein
VVVTTEVGPGLSVSDRQGVGQGRVELAVVAVDMNGRIADAKNSSIDLNLRPETRQVVSRDGLRATATLDLKPGRYQLRVAARDAGSNRIGTVMQDVVVPDLVKPPLAMSQFLLGARSSGAATAVLDPVVKEVLGAAPTTVRRFDPADTLLGVVELYDNRKNTVPPIGVTTTVLDEHDRVVYRSEETVEGFGFEPQRHAYRHRVAVPLRDFAAGDYVLRVDVTPRAGEGATMSRSVAFTVRPDRRMQTN